MSRDQNKKKKSALRKRSSKQRSGQVGIYLKKQKIAPEGKNWFTNEDRYSGGTLLQTRRRVGGETRAWRCWGHVTALSRKWTKGGGGSTEKKGK